MNKILLVFYGGTGLLQKKSNFIFVKKETDIDSWIKSIPELSLMARIETLFINEGDRILDNNNLKELIQQIKNKIDSVQGVIILNNPDTIPLLANQLFWQIQNPSKAIVITGSNMIERDNKILPDLSFKANLINAFQLVNSNLNKVSVIYGDRVISPPKIVRTKLSDLNIFKSIDKNYLAKIGFGLSINKLKPRPKKKTKYYFDFKYNFLFFDLVPDIETLKILLENNTNLKILIFKALPNQIIERKKLVAVFNLARKKKKLVIFYNQIGFGKNFFQDTILTISKISPECLVAKLSWILGQTNDEEKIRHLLKNDIQGEFLNL